MKEAVLPIPYFLSYSTKTSGSIQSTLPCDTATSTILSQAAQCPFCTLSHSVWTPPMLPPDKTSFLITPEDHTESSNPLPGNHMNQLQFHQSSNYKCSPFSMSNRRNKKSMCRIPPLKMKPIKISRPRNEQMRTGLPPSC